MSEESNQRGGRWRDLERRVVRAITIRRYDAQPMRAWIADRAARARDR